MSYDLDKAIAEHDDEREPFTFTFDGAEYTLPAEMDILAVAALSGARLDDGLRMLLGPEQYQRIQDSPKVLTQDALTDLFDAYAKHTGNDTLGESSASTGSSASTARPSNQTSSTITASDSEPSAED